MRPPHFNLSICGRVESLPWVLQVCAATRCDFGLSARRLASCPSPTTGGTLSPRLVSRLFYPPAAGVSLPRPENLLRSPGPGAGNIWMWWAETPSTSDAETNRDTDCKVTVTAWLSRSDNKPRQCRIAQAVALMTWRLLLSV